MTFTFTSTQNIVIPSLSKIIPVFIGGLIAFTLFVLMAKLIEQDAELPVIMEPIQLGTIVFEEPDEQTFVKTKIKPKPETVPPPAQIPNTDPLEPNNEFATKITINNNIDKIKIEPNIGINTNGSARPIVRVNPKYPVEAANKGLEGWVQLSFNIDADGSVSNIKVVDSKPKKIFDKEATRALKRWKYKPSIQQGIPIVQEGMSVVLDFQLES